MMKAIQTVLETFMTLKGTRPCSEKPNCCLPTKIYIAEQNSPSQPPSSRHEPRAPSNLSKGFTERRPSNQHSVHRLLSNVHQRDRYTAQDIGPIDSALNGDLSQFCPFLRRGLQRPGPRSSYSAGYRPNWTSSK